MNCRHCNTKLEHVFLDLGFAPPSNAYLRTDDLDKSELYFPLKLYVCEQCWLVQTADYTKAGDLFSHDYAYFSSTSQTWLDHAASYAHMITSRLGLGNQSLVIEIASNDGYLLKNFVTANIACLGIEPTASTAAAAEKLGVPVLKEFFGKNLGQRLAAKGRQADLIIGNNVYAHVPDVNDFTFGLKALLRQGGTITLEFPHIMRLIEHTQFDTVYHEHFSYLSLHTVCRIFAKSGLRVWDVEELPTHGGSLRIYGCHVDGDRTETEAVTAILKQEEKMQLRQLATYLEFQPRAEAIKNDLIMFLIDQKRKRKNVAAYGAAAKGNTLLNYAGVKPDLLPFVCDAALSKQGKYLPGTHIPILHPDTLRERKPDIVLILPWNIQAEVRQQMAHIDEWSGKFAVAIPSLEIF